MAMVAIHVDTSEAVRSVKGIADDQLPQALKVAINSVASLSQQMVMSELPKRFTIRRLAWAKQGIRVTAASKTELTATVQDIRDYMALQDTGGEKLPRYGQYLCVPVRQSLGGLGAIIPANLRPKAIMASGLGFIKGQVMYVHKLQRKTSRKGFKGVGGFSSGSWQDSITPMYVLVHEANIPARYGFEDLVKAVVDTKWEDEFGKAFQKAVATAR